MRTGLRATPPTTSPPAATAGDAELVRHTQRTFVSGRGTTVTIRGAAHNIAQVIVDSPPAIGNPHEHRQPRYSGSRRHRDPVTPRLDHLRGGLGNYSPARRRVSGHDRRVHRNLQRDPKKILTAAYTSIAGFAREREGDRR